MKTSMIVASLLAAITMTACSPDSAPASTPRPVNIILPTAPPTASLTTCNPNYQVTFTAYEDSYDSRVAAGYLPLTAGYSYTFIENCIPQQVEVRVTGTNDLVGYALTIMTFNSEGAFTGYEIPIAFIDTDGDALLSPQEMDTALSRLREYAAVIAGSQPSYAARFEAYIESAAAVLTSGDIAGAYQMIKQIHIELSTVEQAVNG